MKPVSGPGPYQMTRLEQSQLSALVDYTHLQAIPEVWPIAAQKFGSIVALHDPHGKPEVMLSYTQLAEQIQQFASGLQALGVQPGSHAALFADNSPRWFVADQGLMTAGVANAVRSSQADREELLYILEHSESTLLVVERLTTLEQLQAGLAHLPIQAIVLLSDEHPSADTTLKILNFSQLMALGHDRPCDPVPHQRENLATLIYTSGTTGRPKGVMLTQANLLSQITTMGTVVQPQPGNPILSILPTWHSYERTVEYFLLSQGCTQVYTSIRYVKQDLKAFKPNFMVAVPRLWESIYEGVQRQFREQPASKQNLIQTLLGISQSYVLARRRWQDLALDQPNLSLINRLVAGLQMLFLTPVHALADRLVYRQVRAGTGGALKQVISGGGSLATHLELFFEIVGIEILVGYGLTETSPILSARRSWRNLRGSSGQRLPGTELKVVDPETRAPLSARQRGLVLARGPQVMQGYYRNPEATQKAIDAEGWFDTGDLGYLTPEYDIVLTGRAKDTIVLSNGENIEPQPIEDACIRSPFIDQIMLVGQDQKMIGALIVPNLDALVKWATAQNLTTLIQPSDDPNAAPSVDLTQEVVQELIRRELSREVKNRPGYRPDDRIGVFRLISEPFSIENGLLTQTLKIRRNVVMERYRDMINGMFV